MNKHIQTNTAADVNAAPAAVMAPATGRAPVALELRRDDLLARRIRSEYLEMPGLNLTLTQAQRMWNLRRDECERLLEDLVDAGFLSRTEIGLFIRAGTGRAGV